MHVFFWNGIFGQIFPVLCGVRQGSVLSPILFLFTLMISYNVCVSLAMVYILVVCLLAQYCMQMI